MPIIEWNVGFLIGIQEVDRYHQQMVQLLNEAYDEFREGAVVKQSVLDELIGHTEHIFDLEESFMLEISYPNYEEHKQEHELFASRIVEFKKLSRKNKDVSIELLWFLCNWVTHHLRETDAEFGRFVDIYQINKMVSRGSG